MQLCLLIQSGMTNNVDPGEIPEQSNLGPHGLHMRFCQKLWCTKLEDMYSIKGKYNIWGFDSALLSFFFHLVFFLSW